MTEQSRLYSTIKDLRLEKRDLQSQINLLGNKSSENYQALSKESDYFSEMINQIKENFPILADLILNALKMKKKYDDSTYIFANSIRSSSPKIYKMLTDNLNFPSNYKCEKYTPSQNNGIAEYYLDDSRIPELIFKWKSQNGLKSHDDVQATLSVDALFFTPDVQITYENEISGMILAQDDLQKLPLHVSEIFKQNPRLFESFLNFNKSKIIRSAFVFQIQPFQKELPTFTCHIIPTTSGKSNSDIVDMLFNIKSIANSCKIYIKTFAFDGDGTYNELHKLYYKSYISYILKNDTIKSIAKSKVQRVVCDMLHLLKRLRYRLLSCVIHAGFHFNKKKIDMQKIREVLNFLPSIVFNNDRITKMNDALPLLLFSPKCFLKLYDSSNAVATAFWFPITCIIIVMTDNTLSFHWQKYLLECAFWFLAYYQKCEALKGDSNVLKQKKYGEDLDVRFYSEEQAIQLINTVHCQIQMMTLYGNLFCFDRNSSMPLEHKFGQARIRSKDINTLSMFIKSIRDIEIYSLNENNVPNDILVHCRRNSFGVNVSDSMEEIFNEFSVNDFTPQSVTLCFLKMAGFNVEVETQRYDPTKWFYKVIKSIFSKSECKKRRPASSNFVVQGTRGNARSKSLITKQKSFLPVPLQKIKSDEDNPPYKQFNDMFTKIKKRKPSIDDLQSIYIIIQYEDQNCPDIEDQNDIDSIIEWYNTHFNEYESLIFSILTKLE